MNFNRETLPETLVAHAEEGLSKLPPHVGDKLSRSGLEVNVGFSATDSPHWHTYSRANNITSETTISDGRSFDGLSWYDPSSNQIFISAGAPTGSSNVYTHELGHAVDKNWGTGGVPISGTDEFVEFHNNWVLDNELIQDYYRYGPDGTSAVNGASEAFAEGYSRYLEGGKLRLTGFLGSKAAAEELIAIWTKYGIIK